MSRWDGDQERSDEYNAAYGLTRAGDTRYNTASTTTHPIGCGAFGGYMLIVLVIVLYLLMGGG